MIHPTRTNLLALRDKARSVYSGIRILRTRRRALIKEFLDSSRPVLRSREELRKTYGKALAELAAGIEREGKDYVASAAAVAGRDLNVDISEKSMWGIKYREVAPNGPPVRKVYERGYDWLSSTPHLEECAHLFETVTESVLELASRESRLKSLAEEIVKTTRRIRVLEEKTAPDLLRGIRTISACLGERGRESFYRLKKFKGPTK